MTLVAEKLDITETVSRTFQKNEVDGFWYPMEPGDPAVRIQIAESGYQIQRRRNERTPWMPIVTQPTAEFDPAGFDRWRDSWPMVVG